MTLRCLCLLITGLLAAAGALALALPGAARAQAIPPPDADAFYTTPAGLEGQAPGTVLRSREVVVTGGGVPIPARSWQILYRSNDSKGRPIPAVSTIIVPLTPYPGKRPVLSYQTAIDSLASQCNPSYTLRTGTEKELSAIAPVLESGWAVVVTDFEGPRYAYGAGLVAGRTTLDGLRGALRFEPAGLGGIDAPVGMWGYSGGGQATAWALEQQPSYAPELNVKGVAAGGVPLDLEQVARQIDGGLFFGVYFAVSVGLDREFGELEIDSLLNKKGKALKEKIGKQCAGELVTGYPNQRMSDYTTVPDVLTVPRVRKVLEANRLGKATPKAPLFIYHTVLDQLIPVAGPDALVAEYCREGATVFYQRDAAGEHVGYAVAGAPAAIAYLTARFADVPAPTNCGPARDPADGQPAPGAPGSPARGCLARRSPIGPRNIGRIRIGSVRARLGRRVAPARRTRLYHRWCVTRSSGRVTAVFGGRAPRSVARLVATTARSHGNRGVRPGSPAGAFRRAYPRHRRTGRGVYRAGPRSRLLYVVRRGKVRAIAVADRRLLRSPKALRRNLRRAGL